MKNIDIIIMGKTGAGKSTLINAVLNADVAPTGTGRAVTKKNEIYSKEMLLPTGNSLNGSYGMMGCKLNLYDTVGLEIDNAITRQTLNEIKSHIEKTKQKVSDSDIYLVWFCVSNRSSRFEPYELDLIRKLSFEYEIPFVIVLTQCFEDEKGELEIKISESLPQVAQKRILAKDYSTRAGTIKAYGIADLLNTSIYDYGHLKVDILEKKLNELDERRLTRIRTIEQHGNNCIYKYKEAATKVGFVPGGCIPVVHGMCIRMIAELNEIGGFPSGKGFADEIFTDALVGLFVTPFLAIPLLSIAVAQAYVETVGESYLKAMLGVIDKSTDSELQDNTLMKKRLKEELTKLK